MNYKGMMKRSNGRSVEFLLTNDLDVSEIYKHAVNGQIYAYIDFYEKDTITDLQRKQIYALFRDYEEYTGVPVDAVEAEFKYRFMLDQSLDELPSLARKAMKKKTASDFIDFILVYYINNGIPFKYQEFYLSTDVSKMLYALTLKRICWITGKPGADIHHAVGLVGQGRDRRKHNHLESRFMALSREAHQEAHTMGYDEFCNKYHVQAIKLSKDNLVELGLMNKGDNTN